MDKLHYWPFLPTLAETRVPGWISGGGICRVRGWSLKREWSSNCRPPPSWILKLCLPPRAQPHLGSQWRVRFPSSPRSVSCLVSGPVLLRQGLSMMATERPAKHMEPVGWEVAKPLLGKRLVVPNRLLISLGVREGRRVEQMRVIRTAKQWPVLTRPATGWPLGADLPLTPGLLAQAEHRCRSPPTSSCEVCPLCLSFPPVEP